MIPTAWPSTDYTLLRPKARAYEGFIVASASPGVTFPVASRLAVSVYPTQALDVMLVNGTYSELVAFTNEISKQTSQLFPGLASFTTSIASTQGGLAIVATDPQGRPTHFNASLETGRAFFTRRAHPVGYSVLGQIVQSEAVLLKAGGVEPWVRDMVSAGNNTYTVVRVNQQKDVGDRYFYQLDLQRVGRES